MFFSQIIRALGFSPLVISVKLEVTFCNIKASGVVADGRTPVKCCRKISSFSPLFQKSNKLVNLIFFIFRVQFSVIRHKKSNAETVRHSSKSRRPRSDVLEKVQEGRGIQRIHRP